MLSARNPVVSGQVKSSKCNATGKTGIKSVTASRTFDHVVESEKLVTSPDFAISSIVNLERVSLSFLASVYSLTYRVVLDWCPVKCVCVT